jgi:hypothetical protein
MTAPLTPALALAYLRELSVDVRAAVVLGSDGRPTAGDTAIVASVRELVAAGGGQRVQADGMLLAVTTPDGGTIAVLAGDFSPIRLLKHDLAAAATALTSSSVERSET